MKNKVVELLKWLPEDSENIEINWPKVHQSLGVDHTNWLISQPKEKCQLVLMRNNMSCRLTVEFYDDAALILYRLMWAK